MCNSDASQAKPANQVRFPELDALRGFAILIVIVHHVGLKFSNSVMSPPGAFLVEIGWGGVDVFFAISGFLITRILLGVDGPQDVRAFFVKRFFRIVPLYLVALVVFLSASLLIGQDREVIGRLWMNLLFLTAWVIPWFGEDGVPYTITWSVSVEETAYLLFGAIALLGRDVLQKSLAWIVIGAVLVRLVLVGSGSAPESAYYFAPGRLDAIALGGIFAVWHERQQPQARTSVPLMLASTIVVLGLLALWSRQNPYVAVFGYTAVGIVAARLVGAAAVPARVGQPNLLVRCLARLGLVSYFVYLFHGFAIAALYMALPVGLATRLPVELLALAATLITYLPAAVSWKYFERPLISLGRRLAESGRSAEAK